MDWARARRAAQQRARHGTSRPRSAARRRYTDPHCATGAFRPRKPADQDMSLTTFEWVSFDGADAGTDLALGIAPARWLVVAPQQAWLDERRGAENAGRGALIDVSGRWVP